MVPLSACIFAKIAEAKYFFYLREAKQRNLKISRWK
ncbi:DUF2508 family protein [Bacillus subtilis subsp. subtilis str. SMY]|nr:DUF2508 family protein [Bacillus subtilis subsp. subtilis str. SMY]